MKRIYVAGSGGMLGDALYNAFSEHEMFCSDISLNERWLSFLDFRDSEAYSRQVRAFEPDVLMHVGAHTDLEYCEMNTDDAWATNFIAVKTAVSIANDLDIPVAYIGTAGVFDGNKELYDDWDTPNPIGVYAQTKFAGERYVVENARRYLICRAGWMMGGGPRKDKKFVQKIMSQLHAGVSELLVVNDRFGAPTYTHDFARTMKYLLHEERWGLYNVACTGSASRHDVASEILRITGLSDRVHVTAVDSSHFRQAYFAPRPKSERLVNRKLALMGIQTMGRWENALADYLERDYKDYLRT